MLYFAFIASLAAIFVAFLIRSPLPYPYDGLDVVTMEPERVARFPRSAPNTTGGRFFAKRKDSLLGASRLFEGKVHGAESVQVLSDGTLILLDRKGNVWRTSIIEGSHVLNDKPFAYVGPGRPLGYHAVSGTTILYICNSLSGLLSLDLETAVLTVVANTDSEGDPINYANDLDLSSKGVVYFTSSTEASIALDSRRAFYDTLRSYLLNLCRGDASGRLLAFDPATKKTRTLLSNLFYANGVALGPEEDFVAVVETSSYRVLKRYIAGPRKGEVDVLIDNLPGAPDGISASSDGAFWLCLLIPASPIFSWFGGHKTLRKLLAHLLVSGFPLPVKKWGCVLKISPSGEVLEALLDEHGDRVSSISAATEHDGKLFLGNLQGSYVSVVDL